MCTDPRLQPGSYVHALASRVLRPNDAKNKLGTGYKTKLLNGRVISVSSKTLNNRNYRYIDCVFVIGPTSKRCTLPLSSIKAGPHEIPCRQPLYEEEDPLHALNKAYQKLTNPSSSSTDRNVTPSDHIDTSETMQDSSRAPLAPRATDRSVSMSPVTPRALFTSNEEVEANGQVWNFDLVEDPINGYVKPLSCSVKGPDSSTILQGTAPASMTPLDFFMWMFPLKHLSTIVQLTNTMLRAKRYPETTAGEVLKFFGVLVLMTRCKFSDRRELWSEHEQSPFLGTPRFGKIMSRTRFENLRACIRFSAQSKAEEHYSEENQWELCEDFVDAINEHRRENIIASQALCVDESISRWYGLGGAWIDVGSPHYVKMERKPEHGMEIQDIACGESQIMLGLKLVKSADETARESEMVLLSANHNQGTNILLDLATPWADKQRIIFADSYFASVDAAVELLKKNLKFIGVIKTATSRFPIRYFGEQALFNKGDYKSLRTEVAVNGEKKTIVAVCWLDRNRRHFVATTGRLDTIGIQERIRWRQHEDGACPVEVRVTMPELVKEYYSVAGIVDRHNRIRQDSLDLEKSIEVKEWSFRINSTLLGMIMTDAFQLHKFGFHGRNSMNANRFWHVLGHELVSNTFDEVGVRRMSSFSENNRPMRANSGDAIYLTPTKKRRRQNGMSTGAKLQRLCKSCPSQSRKKSSWVCAQCRYTRNEEVYICHTQTGRNCLSKHSARYH